MRYIKVLLIVVVFFLGFLFLIQNQAPLTQKLTLELDLLVIPKMTSIELPFYFVVLGGFIVGALLSLLLLLWDRMRMQAKLMRANWRSNAIESQNRKLLAQMEKLASANVSDRPALFARIKEEFLSTTKKDKKDAKKAVEAASAPKKGEAKPDSALKDSDIVPDPDKP